MAQPVQMVRSTISIKMVFGGHGVDGGHRTTDAILHQDGTKGDCIPFIMVLQHLLLVLYLFELPSVVSGAFSTPFLTSTKAFSQASARNQLGTFFLADKETTDNISAESSSTQDHDNEPTAAEIEAEELRQRAKQLLAEARAMEARLGDTRLDATKQRNQESDALIEALFMGNTTSVELPKRLVDERWSPDQLTLVIERLHERQVQALGRNSGQSSTGFQIGDTSNRAEPDEEEWNRLEEQIQYLLEAAAILDDDAIGNASIVNASENRRWTGRVASSLRSRLKELRRTDEQEFQRKLAANVNALINTNVSVQEYMSGTMGIENATTSSNSMNISLIMEQVALVPMWIPSSLLPFLIISRSKIEQQDIKTIRDKVLPLSGFYCTSSESIPGAAIFRGNVRTPLAIVNTTMERNYTAVVFEEIQSGLKAARLSDRIQLFFWNDPQWRPRSDERERTQPVVLALPIEIVPEQESEAGYASLALKTFSVSATLLATGAYSISCYALNPIFYNSIVEKSDVTVLIACLPICIGVLAVQAIHEVAQYLTAKKRSRIKTGLPVLLPSFQLGCFGSIMPLRSFPRNRAALLDFALSGPLAGFAISILLMAGGTLATVYASSNALSQFPVVPVSLLKASYFVGSMLSFLAPKTMILPSSQPVPVHPLFMIGFAGLISNALNMLPIGRLDGGRAYTAVFGSRNASLASTLTLALMALLSLTGMSNIAIFWGALVVLFQRQPEIPVRDEVTEVDDVRVGAYLGLLALTIMALSPYPSGQGML